MFTRVCDVLNEYKAELVASSSWWRKEMITVFTEARLGDKPRPLTELRSAFGVNTASGRASKLTRFAVWT